MTATVSTGIPPLDDVLGGLFWGDNVLWRLDETSVEPFFAAIGEQTSVFESKAAVALGRAVNTYGIPGLEVLHEAPAGGPADPGAILRRIRRLCETPRRRLLLFESIDRMVSAWGVHDTQEFIARACPLLLDAGVVACWSMAARGTPPPVADAVHAAMQCILAVDRRSVRVLKADGRGRAVRGAMFRWREERARPVLSEADIAGRVAASVRSARRTRALSQHDVAELAGVTASAISQVERAERGLSVATLSRLSAAFGMTMDDLLRGDEPAPYRIGRRADVPHQELDDVLSLVDDTAVPAHVDLVRLLPLADGRPTSRHRGTAILAVAAGLLQVVVDGDTPVIRHAEVLVAESDRVQGWRNIGHRRAVAFWIVLAPTRHGG